MSLPYLLFLKFRNIRINLVKVSKKYAAKFMHENLIIIVKDKEQKERNIITLTRASICFLFLTEKE